jgi:hypothetical protein
MKREIPQSVKNFLFQLLTITGGVLIALFLEGLVEWSDNRALVREARATIGREIADNKKELDGSLAEVDTRGSNLDDALRLANELLERKSTDIHEITLHRSFAELSSASWQTAERTGALGHMEYDEVRRYSRIYSLQDVFTAHHQRALERMSGALTMIAAGDPYKAAPKDLEAFRQHVLALRGDLLIDHDLGKALSSAYGSELKR